MTLKVGGLFLALCAIASAAPLPATTFFGSGMSVLDASCSVISNIVLFFSRDKPKEDNIAFELRTPCTNTEYPVKQAINLRNAPEFDVNKKTVVFVAGWLTDMDDTFTAILSNAYVCRADTNVIVVNTYNYLRAEYTKSASNTEKVGEFVAHGLKNLNIPATDIHLIGHSLGAQVLGSAARHYTTITGNKIARLTGLDPARPCFIDDPVFSRISSTDATFVDIVHSNPGETGTDEAIGQADYFVNGLDPKQPGCSRLDIYCSHMKSVEYFAETVYHGNENNFISTRCDDYKQLEDNKCAGSQAPMGYAANEKYKGIYVSGVNAIEPYGKNSTSDEYLKSDKCHVCPN